MSKTAQVIKKVLTWIFIAIALFMMAVTVISATTLNRDDRSIFGISMRIVLSDSMKATDFAAGDLIFTKRVDASTLKEGDIITFYSLDENPDADENKIVTHKIRQVVALGSGATGFVTYGTTTGTNDATVVESSLVLGKYIGHLPKIGTFFQFLKTPAGYITCILVPFLLLILSQGISTIRLFKQYKSEQNAEIEEEKAKVAADKEETARMMQELLTLKKQMAQMQAEKNGEAPRPPQDTDNGQ